MSNIKVGYKDKKVFNDLNRLITDISNNKVKKEDVIKRLEKCISDLNQLRQEKSSAFQNKMIQVVYQLLNLFGLNKRLLPLFTKKEPDQLRLPDYIKVSYDRFYKIKNNIDNNKGLTTRIKDKSGKVITIDTKDAADLIDRVSKNGIRYNKVKTIFTDKSIKSANIIALEKLSDKLLKVFFDLGEVFTVRFYNIKIFDGKYEVVELKNKSDEKQSKLETQNESLELDKKKEPKFEESIAERIKLRKQKSDEQPDTTNMPDWEKEESAAQRRNQQKQGLKILTPNQMLSGLPISLTQLKARNNSEKLKTEIRQLLYSLYRSKRLTKNIYKSLVDII